MSFQLIRFPDRDNLMIIFLIIISIILILMMQQVQIFCEEKNDENRNFWALLLFSLKRDEISR